jgi:hypothetical protein
MKILVEKSGKSYRVLFSLDDIRWFKLQKVETLERAEKQAFWLSHSLETSYGTQIHD